MKTKITALTLLFALVFAATHAQTFNLDLSKSTLNWHAEKITGFHEGTVDLKSGSFKIEKDKIVSGTFVINMNTVADGFCKLVNFG